MNEKDERQQAYLAQRALFSKFQNQTKQPSGPTAASPEVNPMEKTDKSSANLISRDSLKMIIKKHGNEKCDPEVEEFLQDIVSDFLNEAITASCKLAMHRKGDLLELKDVQMYLDKKYNISIPGYGLNAKDASVSKNKALAKSTGAQSHAARVQEVRDARIKGKGRR